MRFYKLCLLIISALFILIILSACQTHKAAEDSFTFLFFSDMQADPQTGDYSGIGKLLGLALRREEKPRLVLFGGDSVNDGGDEAEWQKFWQEAREPLDGLITASAAGNHDFHELLAQQFDYPQAAPLRQNEGFFYSFDVERVHFIVLDSNIMGAANPEDIEWLRRDLESEKAKNAEWRVAVMHHPIWPPLENPKDLSRAETMRQYFLPVLEEFGVDLILCGHQHMYSRGLPDIYEQAGERTSVMQIMAASGGKESYSQEGAALVPNYLLFEVRAETLNITAFDGGNNVIDSYTLNRREMP